MTNRSDDSVIDLAARQRSRSDASVRRAVNDRLGSFLEIDADANPDTHADTDTDDTDDSFRRLREIDTAAETRLQPIVDPNAGRYWWRVLLAAVSVVVAAIAVPMIVAANPLPNGLGATTSQHLTRDGAIGVFAAAAGLLTAWRPRWAASMRAVSVLIIALQIVGALVDSRDDDVTFVFESIHLAKLVIATLIFFGASRRQFVGPPHNNKK
jgi:hypothetical protein